MIARIAFFTYTFLFDLFDTLPWKLEQWASSSLQEHKWHNAFFGRLGGSEVSNSVIWWL